LYVRSRRGQSLEIGKSRLQVPTYSGPQFYKAGYDGIVALISPDVPLPYL
jgi:hypothetical protein